MSRYDIAIIGTGPAGISAAITAKVRNKSLILFGKKFSGGKVEKAHQVDNYLGIPSVSGSDLQKKFVEHAEQMGIEFTEQKVTMVMPIGDYFALQTSENEIVEAETVIIASGMTAGRTYPGENEYLGMGVSYCATCDAALYKGKKAAVIGFSPEEEKEADFLAEFASKVYYIPMYKGDANVREGIEVLREKPVRIEGDMQVRKLVTDAGEYEVDGVFILRPSIAPGQLVPGLEMDGSHIKTARDMSTSYPGCYAAGDITGQPYQLIKAAGEGNTAALSAVSYIDERRRKA